MQLKASQGKTCRSADEDGDEADLRKSCLALLHVLALGTRPGLPTEVHGDAHEESALVEEVAGDVDAHQQQEEHHD